MQSGVWLIEEENEMNENQQKLTNKQIVAMPMLLSDPCIERACMKAKISKVSFYKWLKDDLFRCEFERQRGLIIDESLNKLKACFSLAVDELCKLLTSKKENIRLRTAERVIEFHLEIANMEKLEERITIIENSLNK